jgi:hypothetical protein
MKMVWYFIQLINIKDERRMPMNAATSVGSWNDRWKFVIRWSTALWKKMLKMNKSCYCIAVYIKSASKYGMVT